MKRTMIITVDVEIEIDSPEWMSAEALAAALKHQFGEHAFDNVGQLLANIGSPALSAILMDAR